MDWLPPEGRRRGTKIGLIAAGSDFDGIESPPQQLDDVSTYPLITRELLKRGYKADDIRKILGGNFIRVLKANEAGAAK